MLERPIYSFQLLTIKHLNISLIIKGLNIYYYYYFVNFVYAFFTAKHLNECHSLNDQQNFSASVTNAVLHYVRSACASVMEK